MPQPLRVLPIQDAATANLAIPNNLPVQLTSLVGREGEVLAARAMLEQANIRLLTLTGPPGVGKTRLGIEIASNIESAFPDGIYFVPLAPIVGDTHLVISTIAQILGVPANAGQTVYDGLKHYLADKRALLLLDNFEQVVESANFIGDLLLACPSLKVIVTSRELLRLYGEHTLPVPPLALPDIEQLPELGQLMAYEAVALFVQRAQASRPDFRLNADNAPSVAAICARLDGLPLAIELAAARVRLMPPQALLDRLSSRLRLLTSNSRNTPLRQQTLRAAIDWGYDLLTDGERTLFRRLSVFVGGCTLEAAELVCGPGGDEDTLSVLETLLDKSMLRQQDRVDGEPRFWMLETIREYGLESMATAGESSEIEKRHAEYFLALAEKAEQNFAGSEQGTWTKRLRAENDNFRAVLYWSRTELGSSDIGLRLAGALGWFWRVSGYIAEGRDQLVALLAQIGEDGSSVSGVGLAKTLHMAGWLAFLQGDNEAAQIYCRRSLALYRQLENKAGVAAVLMRLGAIVTQQGNYAEARALAGEGLLLAREMEDSYSISTSLNVMGELSRLEGDYAEARTLYEESLQLKRRLGGKMGIAVALHNLAHVAQHDGDLDYSYSLFAESLGIFRELASTLDIAMCVAGLAGIAAARGEAQHAAILLGAVGAQLQEIGASVWPADRADYERYLSMTRSQMSSSDFQQALQTGQEMTPEEAFLYVDGIRSSDTKDVMVLRKSAPTGELTAREIEVIYLLAQGLTNAQIAQHLVLSRRTVHAHLQSIYSKLGVNTRTSAVHEARQNGVIV